MSDIKVSEMTETTEINETDLLMIVQEGANKKVKMEQIKGKVLYENAEGTTGNITLNDNIENYQYVEIKYRGTNEEPYSTSKIATTELSRIHLNGFFITTGGFLNTANGRISISANTLTWNSNRTVIDGQYNENGNGIKITKIIGYK